MEKRAKVLKIHCQKTDLAKQKKVSASTNMAQIFTGGRSFFFFAEFFYMSTQIRYANLYFSRAGNSNSDTGSLAARRTSLPKSPGPRVGVGRLATLAVGVMSSSPLSRASSARAPLDRFRR